ncbi:MAG: phosphoglycerate mutase family protein [Thermoleophilaceae bacterium]
MIWLLRHAEAEDGSPDSERPLTERGREQAIAAGRALANMDVPVDACVTSPKVRALETAALACAALGLEPGRRTGGSRAARSSPERWSTATASTCCWSATIPTSPWP